MLYRPQVLPDPWFPWDFAKIAGEALGITGWANNTIVATNNDAHYVPFVMPCDAVFYAMYFWAANGTGNYDIGIYDAALNRLVSSGSTAMSAAGRKTLSFSDLKMKGGEIYYAAGAWSNTSAQILRYQVTTGQLRGYGWGMQASAFPLPNPAVPSTAVNYTQIPTFGFGVR